MTDRIEKSIDLKAPQSRVWKALTDYKEFGAWFRATMDGPFVPGKLSRGKIAKSACGHEDVCLEAVVQKMEPEHYFSFTWHPYSVDPKVDYSAEPSTLVEFFLEKSVKGTLLRVVESGFDKLPAHRRDEALRMNDRGWGMQLENILQYAKQQAA